MGRSTASCFKIIACGSDSVDHGDLQAPERKLSSARNGWSFRKRSARHRVLSNTIISEAPSATANESPESTAANLQVQQNLTSPEKASVTQWTDKKDKISAQVDSNLSDTIATKEDDCSANATLEESYAVQIQAAIRGYLARRKLLKQTNVIKLQAAVRGHLVRRQAVGTLRCVLAIVKLQALVRARHVRLLVEGSGDFKKQKNNSAVDGLNPTVLKSKREAKANGAYTYISVEKLLSNKYARQLMESTPRTKPINIKCDPVKSDSSWKWLERWMSVSSVSNKERDESESAPVQHEKEKLGYSDGNGNVAVSSGFQYEPEDLNSAAEPSEKDKNLFTYDDTRESSDPPLTSRSKLQNIEESNSRYDLAESDAVETTETGNQQVMHDSEKFSMQQPGDPPLKSGAIRLSDPNVLEPNAETVEVEGSECGTELSITSTLDSPDMSDGGVYDLELEPKILDSTDPTRSRDKLGHEAFEDSSILGTELSYANIDHLERNETVQSSAGEHVNCVIASEPPSLEKKLESDQSNMQQVQPGSDAIHVVDKSSPQVSPRNHVTVPESQTTPSSQVSLGSKKSNSRKIGSNDQRKSLSADKSFVSTPNRDSPTRSSLKPPEESKTGKRRKSFGSTKLDLTEQEQGEGSSPNSLPSYMQPTKSARAKALSTASPRSSQDMQDKDFVIKNRPYHPGKNEREGSPRVQRSPSQAQQNAKGNSTHSPQDRKWLR